MKSILKIRRWCLILFVIIPYSSFSQSGNLNTDRNGLAIGGYDPVAYIILNKAVEGKSSRSYNYQGAMYYFSNDENKSKFIAAPEKYTPAYGGWCAYAMGASGEKVKVDPKTFKVINGRTHLFYNFFFNNTLDSWNKDESSLKRKADYNWSKLK
jgi:YHS domain-containing protein